ncbi:MAG: hypothetical protein WA231_23215, partial [Methylocella sp.]
HKNYDRDHVLRVAGKPQLPMSSDPAFLGDPARYNPEELLVTAISSCHVLWYLHLCVESRVVVAACEDCASGRLIVSMEDGGHFESACGQMSRSRPAKRKPRGVCMIARTRSASSPVLSISQFSLKLQSCERR